MQIIKRIQSHYESSPDTSDRVCVWQDMMKNLFIYLAAILMAVMAPVLVYSQKINNSINQITSSNLESYVIFLASPLLKGRMNGGEGIEIAANYIASQAKLSGLKPANANSYFQPYSIEKKYIDPRKTKVEIISGGYDTVTLNKPLFPLLPGGTSDRVIEGEAVFAGYGLKLDNYKYNDFDSLKTVGKILLIMDRAPLSEDGKNFLFGETDWSSFMNIQEKITTLLFSGAKAVLIVADPKSGYSSLDEQYPAITGELGINKSLKGEKSQKMVFPGMPAIIIIHRSVADSLLEGTGYSLEELQKSIDNTLKPHSFPISGKKIKITEVSQTEEIVLQNVAGFIEGSDPVLKNEIVIFSAHYDHIGTSGSKVNTGADDNASGCAALLSMAEAFQSLEKKPLRTVLFLWFSGEEIGLFGSKSYVNNPLFPIQKTVVNLNMDMIGRVKGVADSTDDNPMSGPNSVFVITGNQSKELLEVAAEIDKKSTLDFDYSLSGKDHPLRLFARSDHFNFVVKDIPVLFFTTGLHTDYHTPGDIAEKIDFKKLEMITRTMYEIGLTIANKKTRLIVNNPFSLWKKK